MPSMHVATHGEEVIVSDSPPNPHTDNPPPLALRPKQAAKALGIGVRLLWELTNRGEIPCVRIGRCVTYPVALLRDWLAEQAEGGKG